MEIKKIIISCPGCGKKTRIPELDKPIKVTCPHCRSIYNYSNYFFGISKKVIQLMLFGLSGAIIGFLLTEVMDVYLREKLVKMIYRDTAISFGMLGMCIGGFLGSAEGYIMKNSYRLKYGIQIGMVLGCIGGALSGVLAQFSYSFILHNYEIAKSSFFYHMIVRSIGWAIFGSLLGGSYGIKQNTIGDLKSGLISGLIGGSIGGILFDPICAISSYNNGFFGRGFAYIVIGISLGTCIQFLQEQSLKNNNADMYRPLTKNLPSNLRLLE